MKDLADEQRERLPIAMQRASEKLRGVVPNPASDRLLATAKRAGSAGQRIAWLQRTASAWALPLQEVSACRKGCAHCCQHPVSITQAEAQLLGAAAGVKPARPTMSVLIAELGAEEGDWDRAQLLLRAAAPAGPCPFLADGACSVYESRPVACRTLINLDDDDLLCRKSDGPVGQVTYADNRVLKAYYLLLQPAGILADIREFFPQGSAGE